MSITSISYIIFLAVSLILYYVLPHKCQWAVLLFISITFFVIVGTPWTLIYVLFGALITWLSSKQITKYVHNNNNKAAGAWLAVALVGDLGLLAVLKYSNFFLHNISRIINLFTKSNLTWNVSLIAALGISFYTLQIVGYLLDCYWGIEEAQDNFFKFLLFTCFFPQMVSGPISRYSQLKNELYEKHSFELANIKEGLIRIAYGSFKKVLIAENLNTIVTKFMGVPNEYSGIPILACMFLYIIQIYMDFAGCMDIVIGSAKCFGITMVENFDRPFASRSIQEFWQRWHITLGAWLKDYVMYPILRSKAWNRMGKSLKKKISKNASKKIPTYLAMLILWFCMGLWHGGGWNYIFEGIWFWLVIVIGQLLSPHFNKITKRINPDNKLWIFFQCARTTVIYLIGAIFFYAGSVSGAFRLFLSAINPSTLISGLKEALIISDRFTIIASALAAMLGYLIFCIISHYEKKHMPLHKCFRNKPIMVCLLFVTFLVYLIIIFGVWGPDYNASAFIYGGF